MKALLYEQPGIFQNNKKEKQLLETSHTILKIKRIGICGTDLHAFEGTQPFFNYPRILGHELAAEIIAIEPGNEFAVGDRVTFSPYFYCGKCIACRNGLTNCCADIKVFGVHIDGGMCEYISVPLQYLIKGNDMSFDELALVEPLAIGAHGIRRAGVKPNEYVLVIGAGPIGLGLMEFARIAGAHVIAMDINEDRLAFCRDQLRVPFTVNASSSDGLNAIREITNGDMPTVVIDATGYLTAIERGF